MTTETSPAVAAHLWQVDQAIKMFGLGPDCLPEGVEPCWVTHIQLVGAAPGDWVAVHDPRILDGWLFSTRRGRVVARRIDQIVGWQYEPSQTDPSEAGPL